MVRRSIRVTRLMAALLLSGAAFAQTAPDLPGMAAGILDQTKMAQQAVTSRDKASALDHLKQAGILANQIQQEAPPSQTPLLVLVRREVDTTTTYRPVKRNNSGEMSADRLKRDTSIRDVDGTVVDDKLDVTAAAGRLQSAQAAVEREDWSTADAALAAVANCVVRTQTQKVMPLLAARQNLQLARARVLEQKYRDAVAPLRAAAQALAEYEKQSPGPHAITAESMRQDIEAYAADIAHVHDDAPAKIDGWLDPVNQWYTASSK